jgi:general secretion pathway protein F
VALYEYSALTEEGKLLSGTIEADSPDQAAEQLHALSLEVRQIGQAPPPAPTRPLARSELLLFNEQLASIVEANLPLEEALSDLAEDVDSRRLGRALRRVVADLKAGRQLDEALARQEKVFGGGYAATVRAGLRTGRLGQMLHSYARHAKMQQDTRRVIAAALAYPISVLVFAACVLIFLREAVLPNLMAAEVGRLESDAPTGASALTILASPLLAILMIVALVGLTFWALKLWAGGRRVRSRILLSIPGVGTIRWRAKLAQLADVLAMQTLSGQSLPEALRTAGQATGDEWAQRETETVARRIEEGNTLAEAGRDCKFLPSLMRLSMECAARRNSLSEALYELSEGYLTRAEAAQERLRVFLFPAAIVLAGMGVAVGMFVLVRGAGFISALQMI